MDIELAFDTTGSMSDAIEGAKSDAIRMVTEVKERVDGAAFAVVEFEDDVDGIHEYRVVRPITSSPYLVKQAISSLALGYGGDAPEAHNLVFHNSYAATPILPTVTRAAAGSGRDGADDQQVPDPQLAYPAVDPDEGAAGAGDIGWRSGSTKVVIVLTDNVPHGNLADQGFADCTNQSADPHGLNTANEVRRMARAGRRLYFVSYSETLRSCLNSVARAAGGRAIGHGGSLTADIMALIGSQVTCSPGERSGRIRIYRGDEVECRFKPGPGATFIGWTATHLTPALSHSRSKTFVARTVGASSIMARYRDGDGIRKVTFKYTIDTAPSPTAVFRAAWRRDTNTIDFDAGASRHAESYTWTFGDGQETTRRVPTVSHTYAEPGEYAVRLVVRSPQGRTADSGPRHVAVDPVRTYAPLVYLHPAEAYYPYDPRRFVDDSALMWSHNGACDDVVVADRGEIDRDWLGLGGYEWWLKDGSCDEYGSFFDSHEATAPYHHPDGLMPSAEADEGFYLDVADGAYVGAANPEGLALLVRWGSWSEGVTITYWFFYAYDQWDSPVGRLNAHEGDWERIEVRLDEHGGADSFAYFAHTCSAATQSRAKMVKGFGADTGLANEWGTAPSKTGTHPVVYSARGSHASWWKTGSKLALTGCGVFASTFDQTAKGARWRTWRAPSIADLGGADLFGYGGAWGAVGEDANNSGPAGPRR